MALLSFEVQSVTSLVSGVDGERKADNRATEGEGGIQLLSVLS